MPHRRLSLATMAPGPRQRLLALTVIGLSASTFAVAAPFAARRLAEIPAFVPAYTAASSIVYWLTAVLLFGQFAQQRTAAVLTLAAGYLFAGWMAIAYALSFPGVVPAGGWLGERSQAAAWLYLFWTGGFPLFILAYAGPRRRLAQADAGIGPAAAAGLVAAVLAGAGSLTVLAIGRHELLPALMIRHGYRPVERLVASIDAGLSCITLARLLRNRPYSVLDLWLIVALVGWLFDIALSTVLNGDRYDLGFYVGRCYGLLAASSVLAILVLEMSGLQARLAEATREFADDARALGRRVREQKAELAATNQQLSAVLQASPVAIFMLDRDGRVVLWTASAVRLFGYSEQEALGRLPPYLTENDMRDFRANIARALDEGAATGFLETQRRRKDGALIDVSAQWALVNDEAGRIFGIMYAVADISERKKLESQLQQAQKMEAIGTLTGGMAHDFNNLLGVVMLNLDILRERVAGDREADDLAKEALDAATRGAELIRRLLAFARRQPLQPQRTEINALVLETSKLLERTLGEDITISLDLDEGVWPTVIDSAQLESSLTNLATNARDAMPNGGELTIATANRRLDEEYAAQHAEVAPGEYAMIEISDTGEGMAPKVLAHVFEPFFTTKAPGKGTGLGLSMVYGFIKQSGGHINIYSEPGAGTTVRLYLPRAGSGAAHAETAAPAVTACGGGETILAVEDNASLRRVVVRQLSEIGYRVIEAENAAAAIAVLEREPIALLFTDVVLPGGTSGYELARLAAARWPHVKIVLTSGFPEARISRDGNSQNTKLLAKPYRREDIARVIGEALGRGFDRAP